jgi:amino acid transporter
LIEPGPPDDDSATLGRMGYAQELLRRMGGFSNFAVSFSIICILAGGITSLHLGTSGVGGAAIGLGWPLSCLLSLLVAAALGQIASAFPTAGGLYHWSSILGGRGWGWITAWFNVIGLVTVLSAINVGAYLFILGCLRSLFGFDPATLGTTGAFLAQTGGVLAITLAQAVCNHRGIRLTSRLTDLSGYLIFVVALTLTVTLLVCATGLDFSRLTTFANHSGPAGGDVWPATGSTFYLFLLGLLLPAYTVTGFDGSAHVAEETVDAARNVPRGMVRAVIWSGLFGWAMLIAIVLAAPDLGQAAARGGDVFFWLMDRTVPFALKAGLYLGIAIAMVLCGLATLTSASRMFYAFARDGGLPFSHHIARVSPRTRSPATAIWVVAGLSLAFTIYTPVYTTITSVCVIFLYVSYVLPIVLGLVAYGRTWTAMGPWTIGGWYRPVAVVCVLFCLLIIFIGVQPPNDKALGICLGALALTGIVWFGWERRRFKGPPITNLGTPRG